MEGLCAFGDKLRERHPNLRIDNCASGGRRHDLDDTRPNARDGTVAVCDARATQQPAGLLCRFRRSMTVKSDREFVGLLAQRGLATQDVVVVLGEAVGFIANVLE
jgi:hypothetical protein